MVKIELSVILLMTSIFSIEAAAEIQLSGEIKQGALVLGKTKANNKVTLDNKPIMVSQNGDFVFGFIYGSSSFCRYLSIC